MLHTSLPCCGRGTTLRREGLAPVSAAGHPRVTRGGKGHDLAGGLSGRAYGFLKGVDEVLQVNVVPIGSDVALEEFPEPVPHPVLEQKGQHSHSQFQEEDEHDGPTELHGHKRGGVSHHQPGQPTHPTRPRTTARCTALHLCKWDSLLRMP